MTKSNATRCGMYLRISLDRGEQALGVARQRSACQEKAELLGWAVVDEYVDNDTSASKANVRRPAYQRLLDDIESGHLDAVIVLDVDRLIRRPIELEQFMELTERKGVALANVSGDIDLSTSHGQLMARIKGALAAQEVRRLGERVSAEARQRAERGLPPKRGRYGRLYGYTPQWQVKQAEAAIVREMFERVCSEGQSVGAVLVWLRHSGHRTTTGRSWTRAGVSSVLDNPTYAGLRRFRGDVVQDVVALWPNIIEPETYYRWCAIRAENGGSPSGATRKDLVRRYLLTNIARCGVCQGGLSGTSTGALRADGTRARKLACLVSGGGCGKIVRSNDAVETLVLEAYVSRVEGRSQPVEAPLTNVQVETEAAAVEEYRTAHEAGLISLEEYVRFAQPHSERLVALRRTTLRQARLTGSGVAQDSTDPTGIRATFAKASLEERRAMLKKLIAAVVVLPQARRSPAFDPRLVQIVWRADPGNDEPQYPVS